MIKLPLQETRQRETKIWLEESGLLETQDEKARENGRL